MLNIKVGNIGPSGLTAYEVRSVIAAIWELDAHRQVAAPTVPTAGDPVQGGRWDSRRR